MHSIRSLKKRYSPRLIPGHPSHECRHRESPSPFMPPSSSRSAPGHPLSSPECSRGPAVCQSPRGCGTSPAYLVELELVDDDLGGSDGDRYGLAVALLADNC
jgi:hypothetical protein